MAGKIIGRGQYTIVKLHDGKVMQLNLSSNMPYVQFFARQDGTYTPDYTIDNILITPELYFNNSMLNQANHIVGVTWSINNQSLSEFGASALKQYPFTLKISKNMQSVSQLHVSCKCTVKDPDTGLESVLSSHVTYTKQEQESASPVLLLTYPSGNLFKNFLYDKLTAECKLMIGAVDVSQIAKFDWYQMTPTGYVKIKDSIQISGQGTTTIEVLATAFVKEINLKCDVTYRGKKLTEYVSFATQKDPFIVDIENSNGDKMHNGLGVIFCEAHVSQGDIKIPDADADELFTFTWSRYVRATGLKDTTWPAKNGRKIELRKDDVNRLSTFICEVHENNRQLPYRLPLTL